MSLPTEPNRRPGKPTMNDSRLNAKFNQASEELFRSHTELSEEIQALRVRIVAIEASIEVNTKLTQTSTEGMTELLSIFRSFKGGFKVMSWFGGVIKWIAAVGAAAVVVYSLLQNFRGVK